ncbi:MAG: type I methionyl aminopeptidase [Bdellovibrionaceae bacterium]|nr:type I methionyl aminopeptidase [Pseudobdellovibrionaceae bacterium]MDW8189857.1 type I methionyl aminopeptidase [Pseudobdellovibrionaceae bacterium]
MAKETLPPPLNPDEIKKMREVCRLAARTLEHVASYVKVGVSLLELDQIVYDYTLSHGAEPAPLGYHGYPKSICTSVNDVVCHGVPDEYRLRSGDIVNIDVTPKKDGFYGDTSATFLVGEVTPEVAHFVEVARLARDRGIEVVRPGATTGDIGFEINQFVTRHGFTTVKEIGGHGIGRRFHEEPFVPSHGKRGRGPMLLPWRCITVEPMINQGSDEVVEFLIPNSSIKWYRTRDGKLSAQFEHTVLITDTGYEILTIP